MIPSRVRQAAAALAAATVLLVVPPAHAAAPTVQGTAASNGTAEPSLPPSSYDAPQLGRPAGTGGGRKV
jgi:hypothetical protein